MTAMDWTATRNQIIKQALLIVGVVPLGEEPDADEMAAAVFELQSITKSMEMTDLFQWNYSDYTFNTVAGTTTYLVANGDAIGIDEAWYLTGSDKKPLIVIGQPDYYNITNKTIVAAPERIWLNLGTNTATLYLYPVPDAIYAITARLPRRLKDWDNAGDNSTSELWPSWAIQPLTWKLASNLAYHFQVESTKCQILEGKAKNLMDALRRDNYPRDRGEVRFTPF